jgi:hypothetical protein
MSKAVVCVASSMAQADGIVSDLRLAGFPDSDISVLLPDPNSARDIGHEKHTKAPEGAAVGAGTGGVLGGAIGLLAGIGTLAIPGLGPFIAAGPILAALSGAGAGAAVGGLTGGLVGAGFPEYEAKQYEEKLRRGSILVAVHTEDREQQRTAKEIFQRANADDIGTAAEASA